MASRVRSFIRLLQEGVAYHLNGFRNPERPKASYLICATPRSGSGLLSHCLWSTGRAGHPNEYFLSWSVAAREPERLHEEQFKPWSIPPDAYLKKVFHEATSPNGVLAVKVMGDQMDVAIDNLRSISDRYRDLSSHELLNRIFPGIRYVHIVRRDKVRQAVSWAKASQSAEWFEVVETAPGLSKAADDEARAEVAASRPVYDSGLIAYYYEELLKQERYWDGFLKQPGAEVFEVVYEEFSKNWEQLTRDIAKFVDVPFFETIKFHRRFDRKPQRDAIDAEWAERFREEVAAKTVDLPSLSP